MAPGDPTDPTSGLDLTGTSEQADKAAQSMDLLQSATSQAKTALGAMNNISEAAGGIFKELESRVNAFGFSLKNTGALTQTQTAQFGLLTTAVLGARRAFEGLGGIDTSGLTTFSDQFKNLQEMIRSSPALAAGSAGIQMLSDMLTRMGAPMQAVQDNAKKGMGALMQYGEAFFTSADNGLRLQNVYLQLAARTGNLGEVFKKAGSDLSNINSLLSIQNKVIAETATATGLSDAQVEKFYTSLGAVPKALESVITNADGTNKSMNLLTATIKLAHGTGRDYESVVKDLHTAFTEYGMTGKDALSFTQRFSEISNKFGIELDVVKNGIMGATGAFRGMTDAGAAAGRMTQAVEGLMNDYVGALQKAGMTGTGAIDTVKGMTDQIGKLSTAQKAFLSAQTGGPGGLMGSFQIEKDLREGKIDKVFDRVRSTMQKQFGKIVTLDEASKSPEAASQLQRQMMMLRQGPMGSLVKSDQDAYRVLETFRAKQEGRAAGDQGAAGLKGTGLQEAIKAGTEFEKKSYTQLTAMNEHLAAIRRSADISNLNMVQKGSTAGVGQRQFLGSETGNQRTMRDNVTRGMNEAARRGGQTTANYADRMHTSKPVLDQSGRMAAEAMNDFSKWTKQVSGSAKAVMDTLKQAVMSGDSKAVQSQIGKLEADIKARREAAQKMPLADRQKALAAAQRDEDRLKDIKQKYSPLKPTSAPTGADTAKLGDVSRRSVSRGLGPLPTNTASPAGATVGAAQRGAPPPKKTGGAAPGPGSPDVSVTETGSGGRIKVDVHVNVKDTGGQGQSVTPVGTP